MALSEASSQSVAVDVEVCLRPSSIDVTSHEARARILVSNAVLSQPTLHDGELPRGKELDELASRVTVYGIAEALRAGSPATDINGNGNGAGNCNGNTAKALASAPPPGIPFYRVDPRIILYRCVDSLCVDEKFGENAVKQRLLSYLTTGALFRKLQVRSSVVCWHGIALLHGPPGTGKTTLCRALAQKLAIRSTCGGGRSYLVEVQASCLYSMYFGQSEKQIEATFSALKNLAENQDTNHVFVLLDEVESLAAVRGSENSSSNGNSNSNDKMPGDALRSVNALLTSLDTLREVQNITVLATSNLLNRIDPAFLDRVDIHERIPQPGFLARRNIIRECVAELKRAGILDDEENTGDNTLQVVVESTEGLSGRTLRKLPLIAHAEHLVGISKKKSNTSAFLNAFKLAAKNVRNSTKT